MCLIPAQSLRDRNALRGISRTPGHYKWWAPKAALETILPGDFLGQIFPRLTMRRILIGDESHDYYYVYAGTASNVRQRLGWHVNRINRLSAIRSGALSTLRQTLSSIAAHDQSDTGATNELIDQMYIEYYVDGVLQYAQDWEKGEIRDNVLPLNIQHQRHRLLVGYKKWLSQRRGESKQKGIARLS